MTAPPVGPGPQQHGLLSSGPLARPAPPPLAPAPPRHPHTGCPFKELGWGCWWGSVWHQPLLGMSAHTHPGAPAALGFPRPPSQGQKPFGAPVVSTCFCEDHGRAWAWAGEAEGSAAPPPRLPLRGGLSSLGHKEAGPAVVFPPRHGLGWFLEAPADEPSPALRAHAALGASGQAQPWLS